MEPAEYARWMKLLKSPADVLRYSQTTTATATASAADVKAKPGTGAGGAAAASAPAPSYQTLCGMYAQAAQTRALRAHRHYKHDVDTFVKRYRAGTSVLDLARTVLPAAGGEAASGSGSGSVGRADKGDGGFAFPPVLLLRLILEFGFGLGKKEITRALNEPESLCESTRLRDALHDTTTTTTAATHSATSATAASTAPSKELVRLVCEVQACVDADQLCSPFADRLRQQTGWEYERRLEQCLDACGLAGYANEQDLRIEGFAKTPDVRVLVPFAVRDAPPPPCVHGAATSGAASCTCVCAQCTVRGGCNDWSGATTVNWIDSKAMFGDEQTRATHTQQLSAYANRFGSGLVIYWFGFVKTRDDANAQAGADAAQATRSTMGWADDPPPSVTATAAAAAISPDRVRPATRGRDILAVDHFPDRRCIRTIADTHTVAAAGPLTIPLPPLPPVTAPTALASAASSAPSMPGVGSGTGAGVAAPASGSGSTLTTIIEGVHEPDRDRATEQADAAPASHRAPSPPSLADATVDGDDDGEGGFVIASIPLAPAADALEAAE